IQSHENLPVSLADRLAVRKGIVDTAYRHADVVGDDLDFLGGDQGPNHVFDPVEKALGLFRTGNGSGAGVQPEVTGVDSREEVLADVRQQEEGQRVKSQKQTETGLGMMKNPFEPVVISLAGGLEFCVDEVMNLAEEADRLCRGSLRSFRGHVLFRTE